MIRLNLQDLSTQVAKLLSNFYPKLHALTLNNHPKDQHEIVIDTFLKRHQILIEIKIIECCPMLGKLFVSNYATNIAGIGHLDKLIITITEETRVPSVIILDDEDLEPLTDLARFTTLEQPSMTLYLTEWEWDHTSMATVSDFHSLTKLRVLSIDRTVIDSIPDIFLI